MNIQGKEQFLYIKVMNGSEERMIYETLLNYRKMFKNIFFLILSFELKNNQYLLN